MSSFNDLVNDLNEDAIPEVDPASLPEPKGPAREPLYPGTYTFTLPASFDGEVKDDGTRQIVQVNFRGGYALTANPGSKQWQGQISNRPYQTTVFLGGGKSEKVTVNDLALLLKALGYTGVLNTNGAYVKALSQYPGGEFLAESVWTAKCDPKKAIYRDKVKVPDVMGCGAQFTSGKKGYTRGDGTEVLLLPKDENGAWADDIICSCKASLFVNDNLQNIRTAAKKEKK